MKRLLYQPLCLLAVAGTFATPALLHAQSPAERLLLQRAKTLEDSGHIDLAAQTWQQILLSDPNNTEALGGLARWSKLQGHDVEAQNYLNRLRSIDPNSPEIARSQNIVSRKAQVGQLADASRLAQTGHPEQAVKLYRQIFGDHPPDDWAQAYYDAEAAVPSMRPDAINGLRALAIRYPAESVYSVDLGRILTYDARTRDQGIELLRRYPGDPTAQAALRQALAWSAQSPTSIPAIRAYLKQHQDEQLAQELAKLETEQAKSNSGLARTPAERAAFADLAANRIADAESRFSALNQKEPTNPRVLAGLGFVRMKQNNFGGAISYFSQAEQNGLHSPSIADSLETSRFWFSMQQGTDALNANHLQDADKLYGAALRIRPNSPDALEGLAGVYMKGQQPAQAIPIYRQLIKQRPSEAAWRGLFLAESQSGDSKAALAVAQQFPAAIRTGLGRDPEFLQALATAYTQTGQDAKAQQVLSSALNLPYPDNGKSLKSDTRMQYASLLAQDRRYAQAAGIYRDVLQADPANVSAWQGLVSMEHLDGKDADAIEVVEQMPPVTYDAALRDPNFLAMLAAIYQQQNHPDVAQTFLEHATRIDAENGTPISIPIQLQIAALDLQRNHPAQAYSIFRSILMQHPDRLDAWTGLIGALHQTGHDADALAQMQQIPPSVRSQLEMSVEFQQTEASVYAATGNEPVAIGLLARIQQHYRAQGIAPPAEVQVQDAWLLYNAGDDRDLYRTLMSLGDRSDLTPQQRRTVQTIWASWSERRAGEAMDEGNAHRAIEILTAAQQAFPGNPDVEKALAGGYLKAGQPKQALAIYASLDMTNASATDYSSMVGAALASQNMKQAELWLRQGLARYPNTPAMLSAAARFEQSRGDLARAAAYWKASLNAMPAVSPTMKLAHDLDRPEDTRAGQPPRASGLAGLLNPDADRMNRRGSEGIPLPGYRNPNPMDEQASMEPYGPDPMLQGTAPVTIPQQVAALPPSSQILEQAQPPQPPAPQPSTDQPVPTHAHHHARKEARPADLAAPAVEVTPLNGAQPVQQQTTPAPKPAVKPSAGQTRASYTGERLGDYNPQSDTPSQPAMNNPGDDLPVAMIGSPSAPAQNSSSVASGSGIASDNGNSDSAEIHLTIGSGPIIQPEQAQSNDSDIEPIPAQQLTLDTSESLQDLDNARERDRQYALAQQTLAQASQADGGTISTQYVTPQVRQNLDGGYQPPVNPTPDQMYSLRALPPVPANTPAPYPVAQSALPPQQTMPQQDTGATDQQLMQQNLPPLRGTFVRPPVVKQPNPRETAEMELSNIEGGYSPWMGGTGFINHRSGNPGYDQLSVLEAPIEGSEPIGTGARLTLVVRPSFLDAGQATKIPVLGTSGQSELLGTELTAPTTPPAQQNASGVGGELQLATNTFGGSVGYTPYGFLISNVIGRGQWKPGNGPFTFSFVRDAVKDSQLSYSGLRDPGSITSSNPGNIWGGVISNAFEAQYGRGDATSGYYISGGGQYLTGDHVQNNSRVDGDAGAYWRVYADPENGTLTIGANFFGMHYANNLRYFTYGQGGYFSPQSYLLANVPFTWQGHYGLNWHYVLAGAFGVQAFQEDSSPYFPLDPVFETASNNLSYASQSTVGSNYDFHGEAAYHVTDHWYIGGFAAFNNTRDYNNQVAGFFVRFLFRPQIPTELGPTGLFPYDGLRPHMVP